MATRPPSICRECTKLTDGVSPYCADHITVPEDKKREFELKRRDDPDGSVGTDFDLNQNQNWECLVVGQMYFPKKGTYSFNLSHDDGAMIAFDPAKCSKVSGTVVNDAWSTRSPSLGLPWMAGNNNSGNYTSDPLVINVLADNSTISYEIAYSNWEHSGRLILTCADANGTQQEIVPVSTPLKTGTGTPTWPAWSTSFAPSWPSVAESGGNLIWFNRGPATDFAWPASTSVVAAGTTVVDSNGYKEYPYRAGVDGLVPPAWSIFLNAKVTDGTSLMWINVGGYTAATSFNFSVRNATIDVAYLPPGVINTRNPVTDTITLPLTQTLSKVQVRYGLTNGLPVTVAGEIKMGEVWVEAIAG